jgi:hypothetical protein
LWFSVGRGTTFDNTTCDQWDRRAVGDRKAGLAFGPTAFGWATT